MTRITLAAVISVVVLALQGINGQCPEENGKFAVPDQCDAYIECTDGVPEEKLCPDGLIFSENPYPNGSCHLAPFIQCGSRTKLQPANATKDCPRQFGFYRVGNGPAECSRYMNCAHGVGLLTKCPEGLAFNKDTYRCDWADETPDCDAEAFLGFTCPPVEEIVESDDDDDDDEPKPTGDKLRHYVKPDDCKKYFVCVNGRPRLNSCPKFLAYNQATHACDFHTRVPGCYKHIQRTPINPEVEAIREKLRSSATEEALKKEIIYDVDELA